MDIGSNHDLHVALHNTRNNPQLARAFQKRFKEVSGGFELSHKESSFYRSASMHMDYRWSYDHEYFQRIIERQSKLNDEVVGCIISGMSVLNMDDSSSEDDSIYDCSMPGLQERARSDSSSSDDTDSLGGNDLYEDGESWGCMEQTLKQIISGMSGGVSLAIDTPTLYAFSLHGHAKFLTADVPGAFMQVDLTAKNEAKVISTLKGGGMDFCQAKE